MVISAILPFFILDDFSKAEKWCIRYSLNSEVESTETDDETPKKRAVKYENNLFYFNMHCITWLIGVAMQIPHLFLILYITQKTCRWF